MKDAAALISNFIKQALEDGMGWIAIFSLAGVAALIVFGMWGIFKAILMAINFFSRA